jgi:hypothetical protein
MLQRPHVSLDEPDARHGYSTYLLPLFAQLKYGDTELAGRAFEARENVATSAEALQNALSKHGGFTRALRERRTGLFDS